MIAMLKINISFVKSEMSFENTFKISCQIHISVFSQASCTFLVKLHKKTVPAAENAYSLHFIVKNVTYDSMNYLDIWNNYENGHHR